MPRNYSKRVASNALKLMSALLDVLYESAVFQGRQTIRVEWHAHNRIQVSGSDGINRRGTRLEHLAELVSRAGYTLSCGNRGKGTSNVSEIRDVIDYLKQIPDPYEPEFGILREAKKEAKGKGYRVFYIRLLDKNASFEDNYEWLQRLQKSSLKIAREHNSFSQTRTGVEENLQFELGQHKRNQAHRNVRTDFSTAPSTKSFVGRRKELDKLSRWIVEEHSKLVIIVGIGGIGKSELALKLSKGGIGKTDLSLHFAKKAEDYFDIVIWRSLREGISFEDIFRDVYSFISEGSSIDIAWDTSKKIENLLDSLRQQRCLIIFDNLETILEGSGKSGRYREGYYEYRKFFEIVCTAEHKSCILITSREIPRNIERLSQEEKVHCLAIRGLDYKKIRTILNKKDKLKATESEWEKLVQLYDGNPLFLKLAALYIKEVHNNEIKSFLEERNLVIGSPLTQGEDERDDIRKILDWHFFTRLSKEEREIMYWLAVNQLPVSDDILVEDREPRMYVKQQLRESKERIRTNLISLKRRLPLEMREGGNYSLQAVLMEYTTERLIEAAYQELKSKQLDILNVLALTKAQSPDYVRKIQFRKILQPILEKLNDDFPIKVLEEHLNNIINDLPRRERNPLPTYAAGNILNFFCFTDLDNQLLSRDFSRLSVWQAYLQGITLYNMNFSHSDLSRSVFYRDFNEVLSIAFSSNEKFCAISDDSNNIRIFRTKDYQLIKILPGGSGWICSLALSKNDQIIACCSTSSQIKVLSVQNGQVIQNISEENSRVYSVAFSKDGKKLASGGFNQENSTIRIRTVAIDRRSTRIEEKFVECMINGNTYKGDTRSVAFHPTENILASGGDDKCIHLWDVETGHCIRKINCKSKVKVVRFSHDGSILASGGNDSKIILWSTLDNYREFCTLDRHADSILSIDFSHDDRMIASSGHDKQIWLWKKTDKSYHPLKALQGHTNKIRCVAFYRDSNLLISGSEDRAANIWNVSTGEIVSTIQGFTNGIQSLDFSPDSKILASGHKDGNIRLWETAGGADTEPIKIFGEGGLSTNRIWTVAFRNNDVLASGGDDALVKLWDTKSGKYEYLSGHKQIIRCLAFSNDKSILASGSDDFTIKLWNVDSKEQLHTLSDHMSSVYSVAFCPGASNSHILASGSQDRTIKIWDLEKAQCFLTLEGHEDLVRCIAFIPESIEYQGKTNSLNRFVLVSGGDDCTIKFWSVCRNRSGRYSYKIIRSEVFPKRSWYIGVNSQRHTLIVGTEPVTMLQYDERYNLTVNNFIKDSCYLTTLSKDNSLVACRIGEQKLQIQDLQKKVVQTRLLKMPYDGMDITKAQGIENQQKKMLKSLGAIDRDG